MSLLKIDIHIGKWDGFPLRLHSSVSLGGPTSWFQTAVKLVRISLRFGGDLALGEKMLLVYCGRKLPSYVSLSGFDFSC